MAIQESQQVLHARYKKGQLCQRKNPDVSRAYNSEGDMNFQTQNYYKRALNWPRIWQVVLKAPHNHMSHQDPSLSQILWLEFKFSKSLE